MGGLGTWIQTGSGDNGNEGYYVPDNNATAATNLTPSNTLAVQNPISQAAASTGTSSLFQPQYLGAPATVNASTIDTSQFSPQATIAQLVAGMTPTATNATNQLNQTLADFGVGGGQAVGAQSQLQSQLLAALAPSVASAIQNSQGDVLSADTSNINALNNAATTNAGAANSTNAYNVGTANSAQQQEIADMLNQWALEFGAANQINTGGQSAGNQNAVNFGQDITVTPNPFQTIFGDVTGAASAAAPFLAAG